MNVVEGLRAEGHDVFWTETDAPSADADVLPETAQNERRVVIPLGLICEDTCL